MPAWDRGDASRPPHATGRDRARISSPPHAGVGRLQQRIGNRAVAQLLSPSPTGTRPLSRAPDPTAKASPPTPLTPRGGQPWTPGAVLTDEDRNVLRAQAANRISKAYTDFGVAVLQHVASLNAEDKAKEQMSWALFEIFFGMTAPLVLKGVQGLATQFGPLLTGSRKANWEALLKARSASMAAAERMAKTQVALTAAEKAYARLPLVHGEPQTGMVPELRHLETARRDATAAARAAQEATAASDLAQKAYDTVEPVRLGGGDYIKEGWKSVAKIVKAADVKAAPDPKTDAPLFGETDATQFGNKLIVKFRRGADKLTDDLSADLHASGPKRIGDQELLAIWAGYHADVANLETYREALRKLFDDFRRFVRPIGTTRRWVQGANFKDRKVTKRAVWVQFRTHKRLGLLEQHFQKLYTGEWEQMADATAFDWVPEETISFALEKTIREFGTVETITQDK